jgi:DDE superfamily endonuclease
VGLPGPSGTRTRHHLRPHPRPDRRPQPPRRRLGPAHLTDLGYENAGPGFHHPVKKPQGGELTEHQQAFNKVIRGMHGVAERANALLKVTFKALRRVSLDPAAVTRTARAALVLLQLEHGHTT